MKQKPSSRRRRSSTKSILRLPDLEHAKAGVLNSLNSADAKRGYRHAIDEFVDWYCSEPRLASNRIVVYVTSIAGYVHAVSGNKAKAEATIHQMLDVKRERYVPPYNIALVFAGLRETEAALRWLEQAFADRDVHMPFLLDHKWDGVRPTSQFQNLLSRVGFPSL